jgi:hypothetical protein
MNKRYLLLALTAVIFLKCGTTRPWYARDYKDWPKATTPDTTTLQHSIYLMGDAGEPAKANEEPSMALMSRMVHAGDQSKTSVLWLGDNIYPAGMPAPSAPSRSEAERRLNDQLNLLSDFRGNIVYIPGNHDWDYSGPDGWEAIKRQEQYVENFFKKDRIMLPGGGCPGPEVKVLTDDLVLVVIDSEWWLHKQDRPYGIYSPCDVEDEFDLIVQLEDVLNKYTNKNILLAMHHPLFSNGNHGGNYSLKDHIFPLTLVNDKLYIPLPVIGSVYPYARKYGISRQDLANEKYNLLKNSLLSLVEGRRNIVIAAGHEHNLQLHTFNDIYHIVSGAVTKDTYIIRGNGADFVYNQKGFAKVDYYSNKEVWVEFWVADKDVPNGKLVFRKPLYGFQLPNKKPGKEPGSNYRDSIVVEAIQPKYFTKSPLKKLLLGSHYREEWSTPVPFRYLDMERENGGLTPIKMGGGRQTISLRVKGGDGYEYNLRSLDKDPSQVLPEGFQRTFADALIQDQISASHPYGPLVIPRLSKATGVEYTVPDYRFVPYTPALGQYMGKFAGRKVLKERRPNETSGDKDGPKVIGTDKMLESLFADNDNRVDTYAYCRARLLDMLVCDWDRHEDQWRWKEIARSSGKTYIAVPKDRDQVFGKYDGILPAIVASSVARREVQNFTPRINDVLGMNMIAKNLDRYVFSRLTRQEWISMADSMKQQLTDDVIEKAVRDMPKEIFAISGEEIIRKLKARRDDLPRAAKQYYEILARKADIFLSDQHEYVVVDRFKDSTRVAVYQRKRDAVREQSTIFDRTFYQKETKEIRIYCMAGNDSVTVRGEVSRGIILRIITGKDEDRVTDNSTVKGPGHKTLIYESSDTTTLVTPSAETRLYKASSLIANQNGFREFHYNKALPWVFAEYSPDYDVLLGIGAAITTFGFRKEPYQSRHSLRLQHSSRTHALYFDYQGIYPELFKDVDVFSHVNLTSSNNQINYFGQGSETVFNGDIDQYRVNLGSRLVQLQFGRMTRNSKIAAGPLFQDYTIGIRGAGTQNQVLLDAAANETRRGFLGARLDFDLDFRDEERNPKKGITWFNNYTYKYDLGGSGYKFHKLKSDLQFFVTPNLPFTLITVLRFGGEANIGNYPFYESSFLGNSTRLRGFYNYRFAGRSSVYQNVEVRLTIGRLQSIMLTGDWGLFTFLDHGKVWSDQQGSGKFRRGFGGGLWVDLFDLSILSGSIGFSKEGSYLQLNFGYYF